MAIRKLHELHGDERRMLHVLHVAAVGGTAAEIAKHLGFDVIDVTVSLDVLQGDGFVQSKHAGILWWKRKVWSLTDECRSELDVDRWGD